MNLIRCYACDAWSAFYFLALWLQQLNISRYIMTCRDMYHITKIFSINSPSYHGNPGMWIDSMLSVKTDFSLNISLIIFSYYVWIWGVCTRSQVCKMFILAHTFCSSQDTQHKALGKLLPLPHMSLNGFLSTGVYTQISAIWPQFVMDRAPLFLADGLLHSQCGVVEATWHLLLYEGFSD